MVLRPPNLLTRNGAPAGTRPADSAYAAASAAPIQQLRARARVGAAAEMHRPAPSAHRNRHR
eukprot:7621091-Pyramimonas_sp.AAC.1